MELATSGTEAARATAAEFSAPSVPAVLIPVPANPPSDVSAAILAASAATAHRYPDAAARAAALPEKAVSILLANRAGRPALVLTGHGDELHIAAQTLSNTTSAPNDSTTVTGVTSTVPPRRAGPEQTPAALDPNTIELAGSGTQETYLGVNQSQFGGPVSPSPST